MKQFIFRKIYLLRIQFYKKNTRKSTFVTLMELN